MLDMVVTKDLIKTEFINDSNSLCMVSFFLLFLLLFLFFPSSSSRQGLTRSPGWLRILFVDLVGPQLPETDLPLHHIQITWLFEAGSLIGAEVCQYDYTGYAMNPRSRNP